MTRTEANSLERRVPIGAETLPSGEVHFRVWAPKRHRVEVAIAPNDLPPPGDFNRLPQAQDAQSRHDLVAEENGYFSGTVAAARHGSRYGFLLDCLQHGGANGAQPNGERLKAKSPDDRIFPDPASRFQPFGPASWSQVVSAHHPSHRFAWSDRGWKGVRAERQVIYEMHIGTFTPQGDWRSAAEQLPELAAAGMTLLEIMPVADFPGRFGWGYDGVAMFAPTRLYGSPDDMRHFVDRAHACGLGVILDVVYNHFGNIHNYLGEFSPFYRSDRYENEWADAINFDGEQSAAVREFFIANARYWIEEFHLDGFRFDATQAVHDASAEHILAAAARAAREAAGDRSIYLVAENEPQDVQTIRAHSRKGFGFDALWNDDFHHSARVRLTGQNHAYYSDYLGDIEETANLVTRSFLYQGQRSQWQGKPRGTPTRGYPSHAFVNFLQNHDQVANSLDGRRIQDLTSPGRLRAMTALWLLAPQTPMFFQGQEFAASTPFLYFADYAGDTAQAVQRGRAKFLQQFPNLASSAAQAQLADPSDPAVFERCKLRFEERKTNRRLYYLHRDLLKLRAMHRLIAGAPPEQMMVSTLGDDCLAVRYFAEQEAEAEAEADATHGDLLLLVNLGRHLDLFPAPYPILAPSAGAQWRVVWNSDSIVYGGSGEAPVEEDDGWHLPGEAAVLLQASAVLAR